MSELLTAAIVSVSARAVPDAPHAAAMPAAVINSVCLMAFLRTFPPWE
jgi:hypothetical protein